MAAQNLTVLSSPVFPQTFEDLIEYELRRVDRVSTPVYLSTCSRESAESAWGAGDGFPCPEMAVVHDLKAEQDVCLKHFEGVKRG